MAADGAGNLFFRDGPSVRKLSADGIISTLFAGFYGGSPGSLAADKTGNVFIASDAENIVRKISPDGVVTIVAGTGEQGFFSGDGGFATDAQMTPSAGALDDSGNLLISDCMPGTGGCRIRKVSPDGTIATVAGDGTNGSRGDGGPALSASISYPATISVDGLGRIFLADRFANVVRVLQPVNH
ncbi:MAG: hypothetical protein IT167_08145 [Bryobacterales bacterium]|nr:hypothetical protein [Bryobacterales bacterium]